MIPLTVILSLLTIFDCVQSACTPLIVDDFSNASNNLLGGYVGDDGTMNKFTIANKQRIVNAKSAGSYFYESGICSAGKQDVIANGWNAIQFSVNPGAVPGSLAVNLQTGSSAGCSASRLNSYVNTGSAGIAIPAGKITTVTIPFSSFPGANLKNILSLSFEGIAPINADVIFGPITFLCPSVVVSSSTTTAVVLTTTTTVAPITSTSTVTTATTTAAATPTPTSCASFVIDNASTLNSNTLGGYVGHDATMNKFTVAGNLRIMNAKSSGSYFYESGLCTGGKQDAIANGWTALQFSYNPGPSASGSLSVNLQTGSTTGCTATRMNSYVNTGSLGISLPAGKLTTVTIPLSRFAGANLKNIFSISFEGLSPIATDVNVGPISFVCTVSPPLTVTVTSTLASTVTTVAPSPTPTMNYPISKDGTCGPDVLLRCPTSQCCSDFGTCGTTVEECGFQKGCQPDFGRCGGPQPMPDPATVPPISSALKATVVVDCVTPGQFALTYDDGPSTNLGQLLPILAQNNVKATFFVNAYNQGDISVDPGKSLILQAYNAGHQIASHTYDHLDMLTLSTYGQWAQMQRNDAVIKSVIGVRPIYMRFPFGNGNDNASTLTTIGSWGYKVVWKNADNYDTQHSTAPDAVQQDMALFTQDLGAANPAINSYISLNHDFISSTVVPWTQQMINLMKSKGFKFVTVGECRGEPNGANWYRA